MRFVRPYKHGLFANPQVLSIEQQETLGHTLHTLTQHWPTEYDRYILSIRLKTFATFKIQGKVYASNGVA